MIVVAEVGLAHCGCLGTALAYVQAIASAGASAAKFQNHTADACSRFRPGTEHLFVQDSCRADYWARTSFTPAEWSDIAEACHDSGLEFIASPFSMQAFDTLEPLVDRWKISSSKLGDRKLLDACMSTDKPIIVSTGMSTPDEANAIINLGIPDERLTVLECTSLYPTPPEKLRLGYVSWFQNRGISDHSATIWPSIMAATRLYSMTEVHVVFSRECFGPDVTSSITISELRQLVEGVRFIEKVQTGYKEGEGLGAELSEMREVFGA